MNRSSYVAPICETLQIGVESVLLNGSDGSDGTVDNPGIQGPGEIWFE